MREIKFRVIQNKKILGTIQTEGCFNGGAWFQCDYSIPEDDRVCECNPKPGILFPSFREQDPLCSVRYEQYTGLKDKNGVEIYEGDVVNVYDWGKYEYVLGTGIIEFNEDGCIQTANIIVEDQYDFYHKARFEIVGNIHEEVQNEHPKR